MIDRLGSLGIFKDVRFDGLIAALNDLKSKVTPAKREGLNLDRSVLEPVREAWMAALKLTPEMLKFSPNETLALGRYLKTIRLLVACRNTAVRVTPDVWKEIEGRILRV